MSNEGALVFCGGGRMNRLAEPVLQTVNMMREGHKPLRLSHINFGWWSDGEPDDQIARPEKIRDRDVIFFLSTHSLTLAMQALQFCWAVKHQYGARSLTVVMPFFAFRRQDHPEKIREIHRNLWFVQSLAAAGVDRLMVCDIHSPQTQANAQSAGLQFINIDPTPAYARALNTIVQNAKIDGRAIYADAPDKGSLLRAARLARELEIPVLIDPQRFKLRLHTGEIQMDQSADESLLAYIQDLANQEGIKFVFLQPDMLRNAVVITREDELDTGGTSAARGRWLRSLGVSQLYLTVTHLVLSPGWRRKIADESPFDTIFGGNTIYRSYEKSTGGLIQNVDMSLVIALALKNVVDAL